LKCIYVNDPTLTWNENEEQIKNEFLVKGNVKPRENISDLQNVNNQLAITNDQENTINQIVENTNLDTSIYKT